MRRAHSTSQPAGELHVETQRPAEAGLAPSRRSDWAELLSAKVTGRITQDEALAFKQAILAGGTKIEPTLRAMIRLYAEDEDFRAQGDAKRRGAG